MTIHQKHTAICSQLARLLKEVRKRRGLSLNALARRAGLARQTLSYIEKKKEIPRLNTLFLIAPALGVKLEHLIAKARRRASR
jgi:transcriptional regulator with XRE-family HTH domain